MVSEVSGRSRLTPDLLVVSTAAAGIDGGVLFRPVNKGDAVGEGALTENAIWWIVKEYVGELELGKLAPHDLRRTAPACAASPAGRSNRSNCCWGISPSKPPWII